MMMMMIFLLTMPVAVNTGRCVTSQPVN